MKKILIFVLLPVLLIVGSGAGIYFSGILSPAPAPEGEEGAKKPTPAADGIYYDLPDFIINLKGPQNKVVFLQLKLNIELKKPDDAERCKANLPRLQDAVVTYFHRMEPEAVQADFGFETARRELAQRFTRALKPPLEVVAVHITDLRIQ